MLKKHRICHLTELHSLHICIPSRERRRPCPPLKDWCILPTSRDIARFSIPAWGLECWTTHLAVVPGLASPSCDCSVVTELWISATMLCGMFRFGCCPRDVMTSMSEMWCENLESEGKWGSVKSPWDHSSPSRQPTFHFLSCSALLLPQPLSETRIKSDISSSILRSSAPCDQSPEAGGVQPPEVT